MSSFLHFAAAAARVRPIGAEASPSELTSGLSFACSALFIRRHRQKVSFNANACANSFGRCFRRRRQCRNIVVWKQSPRLGGSIRFSRARSSRRPHWRSWRMRKGTTTAAAGIKLRAAVGIFLFFASKLHTGQVLPGADRHCSASGSGAVGETRMRSGGRASLCLRFASLLLRSGMDP